MVIEPGLPDPIRRMFLRLEDEFVTVQPVNPVKVPAYSTANLPPAASHPFCVAFDTTLGTLVASNGSAWV